MFFLRFYFYATHFHTQAKTSNDLPNPDTCNNTRVFVQVVFSARFTLTTDNPL